MIKLAFIMCMFLFCSFEAEAAENKNKAEIIIKGHTFVVTLEDNNTAKALYEQMPIEFNMSELNGNEKYCYLDKSLPTAPEKIGKIRTGDIML